MGGNRQKFEKVKHNFDKITSENSTNWKLVLFWIIVFEIVASILEYLFAHKISEYSVPLSHSLTTELVLAISVTLFVWFCVYNIIFENKKYLIRLIFIGVIGLYFIITSDFTLQFLLQNINPLHFFDLEFGFIFFVELFLKMLMTYLIYQFIVSIKNNDEILKN